MDSSDDDTNFDITGNRSQQQPFDEPPDDDKLDDDPTDLPSPSQTQHPPSSYMRDISSFAPQPRFSFMPPSSNSHRSPLFPTQNPQNPSPHPHSPLMTPSRHPRLPTQITPDTLQSLRSEERRVGKECH